MELRRDGRSCGRFGVSIAMPRVFAVSDLHTDYQRNLDWLRNLHASATQDDILIVAGDVTHRLDRLEESLAILKGKYAHVLYTPGNHDLWLEHGQRGGSATSIDKLEQVFDVCDKLGVVRSSRKIDGVWFVPVLAWYHASWDREPGTWERATPISKIMSDCEYRAATASARCLLMG